jgi:hypothetical protein
LVKFLVLVEVSSWIEFNNKLLLGEKMLMFFNQK